MNWCKLGFHDWEYDLEKIWVTTRGGKYQVERISRRRVCLRCEKEKDYGKEEEERSKSEWEIVISRREKAEELWNKGENNGN